MSGGPQSAALESNRQSGRVMERTKGDLVVIEKKGAGMNEKEFDPCARFGKGRGRRNADNETQYLLMGEEKLLQSITVRAPLPQILNEICSALDCEISNVVSFISLPEGDESELAAVAMNAALFGLYDFCSEEVAAGDGEALGTLEMYSGILRDPATGERQLIERAKRLAAMAIKRHNEAGQPTMYGKTGKRPARGRTFEWPICMN